MNNFEDNNDIKVSFPVLLDAIKKVYEDTSNNTKENEEELYFNEEDLIDDYDEFNSIEEVKKVKKRKRKIGISASIPEDTLTQIREIAEADGKSLSSVIEEAFNEYIAKRNNSSYTLKNIIKLLIKVYDKTFPEDRIINSK